MHPASTTSSPSSTQPKGSSGPRLPLQPKKHKSSLIQTCSEREISSRSFRWRSISISISLLSCKVFDIMVSFLAPESWIRGKSGEVGLQKQPGSHGRNTTASIWFKILLIIRMRSFVVHKTFLHFLGEHAWMSTHMLHPISQSLSPRMCCQHVVLGIAGASFPRCQSGSSVHLAKTAILWKKYVLLKVHELRFFGKGAWKLMTIHRKAAIWIGIGVL